MALKKNHADVLRFATRVLHLLRALSFVSLAVRGIPAGPSGGASLGRSSGRWLFLNKLVIGRYLALANKAVWGRYVPRRKNKTCECAGWNRMSGDLRNAAWNLGRALHPSFFPPCYSMHSAVCLSGRDARLARAATHPDRHIINPPPRSGAGVARRRIPPSCIIGKVVFSWWHEEQYFCGCGTKVAPSSFTNLILFYPPAALTWYENLQSNKTLHLWQ